MKQASNIPSESSYWILGAGFLLWIGMFEACSLGPLGSREPRAVQGVSGRLGLIRGLRAKGFRGVN